MKILALILDTLREIYARKAIIGIIVIEAAVLVITGLILNTDGMQRLYKDAAASDRMMYADTGRAERDKPREFTAEDSVLLGIEDVEAADTLFDSTNAHKPSQALKAPPIPDSLRGRNPIPAEGLLHETVVGELAMYANSTFFVAVFVGIFLCAGIIPSMMEKGAIDLVVSKPISRTALLFGRALGGLVAMAANLLVFVVAVWALYGWMSGIWYTPFITWAFMMPLYTLIVILSGVILLNVLTESWVLPMIIAYLHVVVLSQFLSNREALLFPFIENDIIRQLIDGLYYVLPQSNDFFTTLSQSIYTNRLHSAEPFVQGGIFTVVMLALAAWKFERKDF